MIFEDKEATLWQSTNIALPNGKYLIALYYYKADKKNRKNGFYHCAVRIDTRENWNNLRNSLLTNNPAENLNLEKSLGIIGEDYDIRYSKKSFNKADMYKWFGCKFSENKIETLEDFVNKSQKERTVGFITKYNINGKDTDFTTDYEKFKDSEWYVSSRPKLPRKPYGKVIH